MEYKMKYNPEFHGNHGKAWNVNELIYLCSSWEGMRKADIAFALERTEGAICTKVHELKIKDEYDHFKNLGK